MDNVLWSGFEGIEIVRALCVPFERVLTFGAGRLVAFKAVCRASLEIVHSRKPKSSTLRRVGTWIHWEYLRKFDRSSGTHQKLCLKHKPQPILPLPHVQRAL